MAVWNVLTIIVVDAHWEDSSMEDAALFLDALIISNTQVARKFVNSVMRAISSYSKKEYVNAQRGEFSLIKSVSLKLKVVLLMETLQMEMVHVYFAT